LTRASSGYFAELAISLCRASAVLGGKPAETKLARQPAALDRPSGPAACGDPDHTFLAEGTRFTGITTMRSAKYAKSGND
jgi:hypothetical protein